MRTFGSAGEAAVSKAWAEDFMVCGELRHSRNWESRDAFQQRGEALAPASVQT